MNVPGRTTITALVLVGVTTTAGCATSATVSTAAKIPASSSSLSVATMTAALAAFDTSDSAASSAGNLAILRRDETFPSIAASVASVNRDKAAKRTQPGFRHTDPAFAAAAGAASCFLAAATLKSAGQELGQTDLSEFLASGAGGWQLSDHAIIDQADEVEVDSISAAAAVPAVDAIDATRRSQIADQLFYRSTGTDVNDALIAPDALLDQQFAGGWQVYQQQMATYGMSVHRSLGPTSWAPCAGRTQSSTLAFLRLSATDTISPSKAGGRVYLSPMSPDVSGVGRTTTVVGRKITVQRVQDYLVSVPDNAAAPVRVLAISDAPTGISAAA